MADSNFDDFFDTSSPQKRLKISNNSYTPRTFNSDLFEDFVAKKDFPGIMDGMREFDVENSPSHQSPDCSDRSGLHINLGITSSCDPDMANGGDSGFIELASPESTSCADFSGVDRDEPDSCASDNGDVISQDDSPDSSGVNLSSSDDSDDQASTISELSGLSELSGHGYRSKFACWVQKQKLSGVEPRSILEYFCPPGLKISIPEHIDDWTLWEIVYNVLNDPPRRVKLDDINTFNDVLRLLTTCKKIIVLTGAGVSVSCGIPDFRSRDGIYARLAKDFPDLPDPQSMFDIQYFKRDPRPFYKFAKEVFPGSFEPSTCHKFIKLLEDRGQLLRSYTQNIDTLEKVAGIKNVVECHGSFATASCLSCSYKVDSSAIKDDVFSQRIPYCPNCSSDSNQQSVLKPDIVFFGEGLPEEFHSQIEVDKDECDLLVVIGSSLKVRPVALIPNSLPAHVPQILINREPLLHCSFDVELLGDCDVIVNEICRRLGQGWNHLCYNSVVLNEVRETSLRSNDFCHSPCSRRKRSKLDLECDSVELLSEDCNQETSSNSTEGKPTSSSTGDNAQIREDEFVESSSSSKDLSRVKVVSGIPENSYLFCHPSKYIFSGAEVYESDVDNDVVSESKSCSLSEEPDNEVSGTSSREDLTENGLTINTEVDGRDKKNTKALKAD